MARQRWTYQAQNFGKSSQFHSNSTNIRSDPKRSSSRLRRKTHPYPLGRPSIHLRRIPHPPANIHGRSSTFRDSSQTWAPSTSLVTSAQPPSYAIETEHNDDDTPDDEIDTDDSSIHDDMHHDDDTYLAINSDPNRSRSAVIEDIASNSSSTEIAHVNILVVHLITQLPVKSAASNHSPSWPNESYSSMRS